MKNNIRVGIIGVSPDRGWATVAHIPALKALPFYEITAISNRNADKAAEAAKAFHIPQAFTDNQALIESPDVDLVVITVKVPEHRALVTAALNAGKQVYCEWPLGNGLEETTTLAALADAKQIHGTIGLQSRALPVVRYVRDLVAQGHIGEVLSTSMIGSGIIYGGLTEQAMAYAMDADNGAGMIYATFGHAIDALCFALGEFSFLNATTYNRRKTTTIIESGETIPMTAHDQLLVSGVLESGAPASVHYRGGMFKGTNFHWEINGTEGDLVLTSALGHPGVLELTLKGSVKNAPDLVTLDIPAHYKLAGLEANAGPAYAVAHHYALLAQDLQHGDHKSATFANALKRHRLIKAIETASDTGMRQAFQH